MFQEATFADLPMFGAAHCTRAEDGTGCTVLVAEDGAVGAVDVRGGAPATRETDLLRPENMVEQVNAIVLSGGSAFGLEAACGVMEELAGRDVGFKLAGACVPIVCGASLFDLPVGKLSWPNKDDGARAARAACQSAGADLEQGCVGAGTGATVGKMGLPQQAMKSGFGWAGLRLGELVVIANVAVNALGNVVAEDGSWLAGALGEDGRVEDPIAAALKAAALQSSAGATGGRDARGAGDQREQEGAPVSNTTIGCILTNARLVKAQATKVAQMAQDAYARCIKPVHTPHDGDTIFVMASGDVDARTDMVGILATEAMERAIRSAVRSATGAYGLRAACDIEGCA